MSAKDATNVLHNGAWQDEEDALASPCRVKVKACRAVPLKASFNNRLSFPMGPSNNSIGPPLPCLQQTEAREKKSR